MRPAIQLRSVWPYLPAFRAVAEAEHLPTAGAQLGVTPSSLSRAIRILEDVVGARLFLREGRALRLNDHGRLLLATVRDAMRGLDEGVAAMRGGGVRGRVVAAALADLAHLVLAPAAAKLADTHPGLELDVIAVPDDRALSAMLLRGEADAAVTVRRLEDPQLGVEALGRLARAGYVARDHPLARGRRAAAGTRCVVVDDDDGWPAGVPRVIAARVPDERTALAVVAAGSLVGVTYAALASAVRGHPLVRLASPTPRDRELYLVTRRPVAHHPRTEALAEAIRAAVRRAVTRSLR